MKADARPPWIAHDERERKAMVAWVNAQLDQQRTIDPTFGGLGITNWFAWIAACHGNMQPVRVLFPWLAPFLQPRRFGRGEHPRHKRQWAIDRAVEDVVRIRAPGSNTMAVITDPAARSRPRRSRRGVTTLTQTHCGTR
jgi:hypothetical protein